MSTGSQRVGHDRSDPVRINIRLFFACGSSVPVRVEHEGGAAAWLLGTLAAPSVQGHGLPPPQELWPYQSLLSSLLQLAIRSLWPVFLHSSAHSGTYRAPLPGVLLCCLACQAHRGASLTGVLLCRSVCQAFDGPASLLFSCRCWHVGGERLW